MASRDYLKHIVSSSEPTSANLGDEYYNLISNQIFKRLAVNGTSVQWVEQQQGISFQANGIPIATAPKVINFPSNSLTFDNTSGILNVSTGTVTSVAALTLGTTGTDVSSTVANGTTTPVITLNLPTASAANRGLLSSTDWTTFNNKTSNTGTVTSVAALTIGTTGTDITSTVATGTTTPVITLNIPTASASNRGALSSTDWSTFNGKITLSSAITGYTAGTNTALAATDTLLAALGKLQGQVTARGTGTVTSVGGTGTVSGLTLTGTVTTTGNLTLGGTLAVTASNFASQTAATFLAAPNAAAGVPTFRAIVAADIPTLNQSTTGSAATLTTTRTIWGQNFNGGANVTGALTGVTTLSMNSQLTNTVAVGTAPFVITSTTRVANLNVATAGTADTLVTTSNPQVNSLGVGTAASTTAGQIRATNDITAYFSDERLKTFQGKITNALEKINSINGYYFYENELAKELGYTNTNRQVGVSAQEVQKILPEVVVPAPVSDDYLTVKYEKLVPLLIEAIKEQQTQIADLQNQLNQLKK